METKLRVTGVSKLEVNYDYTFSNFLKFNPSLAIEIFNIAKSLIKRIDDKYEYVKVESFESLIDPVSVMYIKTSEYNNSNYANTSV